VVNFGSGARHLQPDAPAIKVRGVTARAVEAVVFDWDGTLVDSKRVLVASFQETTSEVLGAPFPGALETIAGLRAAGLGIGVATSKSRSRLDPEEARAEGPDHVIDGFRQLLGLAGVAPA
jgi:beta-phosphoglucomutase-like phosphatase (HAD superfamily)